MPACLPGCLAACLLLNIHLCMPVRKIKKLFEKLQQTRMQRGHCLLPPPPLQAAREVGGGGAVRDPKKSGEESVSASRCDSPGLTIRTSPGFLFEGEETPPSPTLSPCGARYEIVHPRVTGLIWTFNCRLLKCRGEAGLILSILNILVRTGWQS